MAAHLGLEALALTDHDGLYGVVRFFEAAREPGSRPCSAARRSPSGAQPQAPAAGTVAPGPGARTRVPDPPGSHLVVLARDPRGTPGSPGL